MSVEEPRPATAPATLIPAYSTDLGRAFQGDASDFLSERVIADASVDLIMTSPPFALTRPKRYGNEPSSAYIGWFRQFLDLFRRVLKPTGSLVIDIGGTYLRGKPARSTYHFELAVEIAKQFDLCQEFYWYNPAKLPSPAQWVTIERIRAKDSVNPVYWFAQDAANTKADNTRVLKRYSSSMEALLRNGYQHGMRPSGHLVSSKFDRRHDGAIPSNLLGFADPVDASWGSAFEDQFPNLLAISNTSSNDRYLARCAAKGLRVHPARFPVGLPAFFIEFLTRPGDLVIDPFAGSNTTGLAAEALGRRWMSTDLDTTDGDHYVFASSLRFESVRYDATFEARYRAFIDVLPHLTSLGM